jgi:hypothetical protein
VRAITVSNYGATPSVTELPAPRAGPGQVLIATHAAGMNPMNITIASGGWFTGAPLRGPSNLNGRHVTHRQPTGCMSSRSIGHHLAFPGVAALPHALRESGISRQSSNSLLPGKAGV